MTQITCPTCQGALVDSRGVVCKACFGAGNVDKRTWAPVFQTLSGQIPTDVTLHDLKAQLDRMEKILNELERAMCPRGVVPSEPGSFF